MSQGFEGYIDEYNQLRAEIRMYLEHDSKSLQIAMALGAAAATFGPDYPQLLIVSSLIVSFLWYDMIRHFRAVQRVASYLEVCVEPYVPGLNWETNGGAHPVQPSFVNRAIANMPLPTLVVAQALYGFHLACWPLWLGFIGVGVVTSYLFGLSYWTVKHARETERKRWQDILRQRASVSGTP